MRAPRDDADGKYTHTARERDGWRKTQGGEGESDELHPEKLVSGKWEKSALKVKAKANI